MAIEKKKLYLIGIMGLISTVIFFFLFAMTTPIHIMRHDPNILEVISKTDDINKLKDIAGDLARSYSFTREAATSFHKTVFAYVFIILILFVVNIWIIKKMKI